MLDYRSDEFTLDAESTLIGFGINFKWNQH